MRYSVVLRLRSNHPTINSNARYGIDIRKKALYRHAATRSRCNNECIARCEPHPGHFKPVSDKNIQRGNGVVAGSKLK